MRRFENIGIYFIITLFFISMGTASAADITVNNSTGPAADYTSIQAAVDAAEDGDTIVVYSGIYTEHVDVNKELTIISNSGNPEDTVVCLPDTEDDVFLVTSNNVTINGLKIIGHTYSCMGIHFLRVQYNNVSNNFFVGAPIWFISSDNNLLINNKITDCNIGLSYSSNNMMADNTISTFTDCFMFEDSCSNNTVSNNSMDGRAGVRTLEFCNNNTIKDNYINAFERSIVTTESNNNVIYNNFFDGTVNVYDDGNNIWNITKTPGINIVGGPFLGGNYWSDYEGIDTDGDGLGDTLLPHNSSEIANGGDYLPLVSPESPPPITYITVNNSTGQVADYTSIQAAVDAAKDGDTILVYSGTYTENVVVNKELTIISQSGNPEDTIVKAVVSDDHVFNVIGKNVTISGFTVTGATKDRHAGIHLNGVEGSIITNNIVSDNDFGICLRSNNNMLTGNTVSDNAFGIYVEYSNNNTLTDNTASNNYNGIFVWYSSDNMLTDNTASNYNYGISLEYSSYNTLTNNTASNNSDGFYLGYTNDNMLANNTASNNDCGVYLHDSSDNMLTDNMVSQNEEFGIYLTRSMDNLIYNNYFNSIDNVYDDENNIWNITKTPGINIIGGPFLGGNYWSDYAGADTNGDGLGDTLLPYNSEGQIANGGDYLPLVTPAGPPAVYTVNNSTGPTADYTSIQAAVDAAKDGDTIIVYSGIYKENIDVNKELTITSQSGNPDDTIVQVLEENDYVFNIAANDVTISGFKVEASWVNGVIYLDEVQRNNISDNEIIFRDMYTPKPEFGIGLNSSSNNTLNNNTIYSCLNCIFLNSSSDNTVSNNFIDTPHNAIYLKSSNNNTVNKNYVNDCDIAIRLRSSNNNMVSDNDIYVEYFNEYLIYLTSSSNNIVSNNHVGFYGAVGIGLRDSSDNNIVSNNTVYSNYACFELGYSDNNTLKDNVANEIEQSPYGMFSFRLYNSNNNTLTGNIATLTKIQEGRENIHLSNSMDNVIYNNYFNSTYNVYDDGNNIWNITKTPGTNIIGGPFLGGNYWSDYAGVDYNGDGLGDTLLPYNCEGQIANGGDYLPLVIPGGPIPPIPATVDILPGVLNLNNSGGWITAYIELPEGCDVNDIEVSTILLMGSIPAESSPLRVGDYDADGILDLMVKFDKNELIPFLEPGDVELTVTGELIDGSVFEGTDTIQVNS